MSSRIKYFFVVFFFSSFLYCQTDVIDVVSTGVGSTESESIKNALISALERSFGAFISSRTEIINDVIKDDEVTSLTTGNVISYEIESKLVQNENHFVTVKSKVSLIKFSNYIKSKGHNITFDGKGYGIKMKIQKFKQESEEKTVSNILKVFESFLNKSIEFKLEVDQPVLVDGIPREQEIYGYRTFQNTSNFEIKNRNYKNYGKFNRVNIRDEKEIYRLSMNVIWGVNNEFVNAYEYLINSLLLISMNEFEIKEFHRNGRTTYPLGIYLPKKNNWEEVLRLYNIDVSRDFRKSFSQKFYSKYGRKRKYKTVVNFRSDKSFKEIYDFMRIPIFSKLFNFKIVLFGFDTIDVNHEIKEMKDFNLGLGSEFGKWHEKDYLSFFKSTTTNLPYILDTFDKIPQYGYAKYDYSHSKEMFFFPGVFWFTSSKLIHNKIPNFQLKLGEYPFSHKIDFYMDLNSLSNLKQIHLINMN